MRKLFDALTQAFIKHGGILSYENFHRTVASYGDMFDDEAMLFFLLQASGYPIEEDEAGYRLRTYFTPWKEERYCIIDIETNGAKPDSAQVIEIGAVMLEKGKIVDRFETFVACAYLPEYITKITGIVPEDLKDAPGRREALTALRAFMGDAIFTAHNVDFDYGFLNASFERFGLGSIGNRTLCTIDLARRTFESERYGLAYLRESLQIDTPVHHRAYADALSAMHVLQKSFRTVPSYVKSTEDLLRFSKSSKKQRRKAEERTAKDL
jgi:DNA polymerase-3 subunit epsilon